jgi:hypothetical protein
MAAESLATTDQADLLTWSSTTMRRALKNGELSARSFQEIFGWDDANLTDAIQRATESLWRANIKHNEPWRVIRTSAGTARAFLSSLKQLNAEADLVSRSFYSDGLFRLPHEKDGSSLPSWFELTMVYNRRDPRFIYGFATVTLEFLRFARVETEVAEHRVAREAGATMGNAIDLRTPSPPLMKNSELRKLRRKEARQPSTAAQRAEWKLKEAARSRVKLAMRGRKPRRNTLSVESSPTKDETFSIPAPLSPSNTDVPPTDVVTPLRSRFVHEVEVEAEDDGGYGGEEDLKSDAGYQSEEDREVKKRTQTILWSRKLWFDD